MWGGVCVCVVWGGEGGGEGRGRGGGHGRAGGLGMLVAGATGEGRRRRTSHHLTSTPGSSSLKSYTALGTASRPRPPRLMVPVAREAEIPFATAADIILLH